MMLGLYFSLFFISDTNKLVRLKRKTGQTVWVTELPFYSQKRLGLSKKNVQYYGPIIAGNQLIIASSDGYISFYDPKTGEQKNKLKILLTMLKMKQNYYLKVR